MSIRPQIDDPQGVADTKAQKVLRSLKTIVDEITGRTPKQTLIQPLTNDANLFGVIDKVNALIGLLQGAAIPPPGKRRASPASVGTVTSITITPSDGIDGGGTITDEGTISLSLGDITPDSINFGQDDLDYFDVVNWAPTDASGATLAFSSASGTCVRIGNYFLALGYAVYPVTADVSNAAIGGLPFTVANTQDARQGFISYTQATVAAWAIPNANSTVTRLFKADGSAVINSDMSGFTILFGVLSHV